MLDRKLGNRRAIRCKEAAGDDEKHLRIAAGHAAKRSVEICVPGRLPSAAPRVFAPAPAGGRIIP